MRGDRLPPMTGPLTCPAELCRLATSPPANARRIALRTGRTVPQDSLSGCRFGRHCGATWHPGSRLQPPGARPQWSKTVS